MGLKTNSVIAYKAVLHYPSELYKTHKKYYCALIELDVYM